MKVFTKKMKSDYTMGIDSVSSSLLANPREHAAGIESSSIRMLLRAAILLCVATPAIAQVVEDHSLPKSVVKTLHVKCSSGRLAMIRYDTRAEPTNMCVSVQDGAKPQRCVKVVKEKLSAQIDALAKAACD